MGIERTKVKAVSCPHCDSSKTSVVETEEEIADRNGQRYLINGFQRTVCKNCGLEFVPAKQAKEHVRLLAGARRQQQNLLTTRAIKRIRESLGLRQEDASRLFGG